MALRCDYAALAGVPLGDVFISSSQGVSGSPEVAAAAAAAANLATSCPPASRRELAAAAGGSRAMQSGSQWADFTFAVVPPVPGGAVTSATIIAAVAGAGASDFSNVLAVWSPVWSLSPAAFVLAVGGGPVLLVSQPALVSNITPTPAPSPTSPAALQLGLGLGLGIGVPVVAAAIIIIVYYFCRRTSREEFSKPEGLAAPEAATAFRPQNLTALNSYRSQSLNDVAR